MTKLDLLARMDRLVAEGAVPRHGADVRLDELDEFACAEDMFGCDTSDIDVVVDRISTAMPTGHRTWSSYGTDEDGFLYLDPEYILD